MPFCSNCGSKSEDGVRFCSFCGSPILTVQNPQPQQIIQPVPVSQQPQMAYGQQYYPQQNAFDQSAAARQKTIVEMNNILSYFNQKAHLYDEYDECNRKIPILQRGVSSAKNVWSVFLFILGPLAIFGGILDLLSPLLSITPKYSNTPEELLIVYGILYILGGGAMIFGGIMLRLSRKKQVKKNKEELEFYENRVVEVANELTTNYYNYGYCPFGPEYTNPKVLAKLAEIILAGRADTPKEAVNILLDDAHKSLMELQSQLTLQATRQAARGATAAAVFSAANFFFR